MAHKNISNMEDLANQGWSQMSIILDKEIPVKKKRNLILFWWIGSAAAALALIIGLSLHKPASPELIGQQIPESSTSSTITEKIIIETKRNTPSISASAKTTPKVLDTPSPSRIKQVTLPTDSRVSLNNLFNIVKNKSSQSSTTPLQEIIENIRTQEAVAIANQSINANSTNKHTRPLFTAELKSTPGLISKLSTENKIINKLKPNPKNPSKIILGLQALYVNAPQKGYSEFGIGVAGLLPIKNKWSLISSFSFQKRNKLFNGKSDIELSADINAPNGFTPDPADPIAATLVPSGRTLESANTIKLSQLTFQFGLQYQLNPKLAINGSILPSYSIINNEKYRTWYSDPIEPTSFAFDSGPTSPKRWNAHVDMGLSYLLNNQITVGLNYSYLTTRKGKDSLNEPRFEADEWRFSVQYLLD